ncbi:hypothetical protein Dimus_024568, partial [Dionaea muscipula]
MALRMQRIVTQRSICSTPAWVYIVPSNEQRPSMGNAQCSWPEIWNAKTYCYPHARKDTTFLYGIDVQ